MKILKYILFFGFLLGLLACAKNETNDTDNPDGNGQQEQNNQRNDENPSERALPPIPMSLQALEGAMAEVLRSEFADLGRASLAQHRRLFTEVCKRPRHIEVRVEQRILQSDGSAPLSSNSFRCVKVGSNFRCERLAGRTACQSP